MASPVTISNIPLIFIRTSEYLANIFACFSVDVKSANITIIMHWPRANENNSEIENNILLEIVATAIMLASIGEEHGLDASAKNVPTKNGNKNRLPFLFWGIFFTIEGKFISINPSKFSPNIIIIDANNSITTGEAKLVNARPVRAHITPIMLNTNDSPIEKDIICTNSFLFFSFEYPPTYPMINGKIPKLHGDNDAKIPEKNAITIKIGKIKLLSEE